MTTLLPPTERRPRMPARPYPALHRSEPATATPASHVLRVIRASHDFLVPNPRPDLVADLHTLSMLEAG